MTSLLPVDPRNFDISVELHWMEPSLSHTCICNIYLKKKKTFAVVLWVFCVFLIWLYETGLSPPVNYFYWPCQGGTSFVDHLCCLCLVFLMLLRNTMFMDSQLIAALWSPAGKGLTSGERADLLALVGNVYWTLCYFPMLYPGSDVVLDCIVSWFLPSFLFQLNLEILEMSRDMRFPTMWYVRPAKAQTSLRLRADWSEPLLAA